jgi:hypothetical protein
VNPHHVKKSKELDDNNPNKNDRKDPKTIAALVNEGRFSYPYMEEDAELDKEVLIPLKHVLEIIEKEDSESE